MKLAFVFVALVAFAATAFSQNANDLRIPQRDPTNAINLMRNLGFPAGGANGLMIMNGATVLPETCLMGAEFTFTSGSPHGTLTINSLPQARVVNLTTDLAAKEPAITAGTASQFWRGNKTWQILTSGDVTGALAFTPYDAMNPSGFVSQAGARSALSLTTTGSGAATYNSTTGVLNIPTPPTAPVTSVTAGTGMTVSPTTGAVVVSLPNTGTANTYNGSFTTDSQGRVTAANNLAINDAPGRSIVTTTSSTGFQVDASRAADLRYDIRMSGTATITGAADVYVYLETANTNSTTPADWTTIAEVNNGQTISLAVVLQSVQKVTGSLSRMVNGGKYVRIRSNITGTGSASIGYAQETKQ